MNHRKRIAALFCSAILFASGAGYIISQSVSVPTEARVAVQKLSDGRIEVALDQGGERHLPERRFVPANAQTDQWLRSSPVSFEVEVPEPEAEVVEVEVEKIVEVEKPIVRLSVRPSDHEERGFTCLEEVDEDGNSWTWTRDEDDVTGFDAAFGVYMSGLRLGEANSLIELRRPQSSYQDKLTDAAWLAQCASYHGLDVRLAGEYETNPDEWME